MLKALFFGEADPPPLKDRVRQWTRELQKRSRTITRDMDSTYPRLRLLARVSAYQMYTYH
jgi:hypothetical protein